MLSQHFIKVYMGLFYSHCMVVIVNVGDVLIIKVESGEGLLYSATHDLINPFSLIKT